MTALKKVLNTHKRMHVEDVKVRQNYRADKVWGVHQSLTRTRHDKSLIICKNKEIVKKNLHKKQENKPPATGQRKLAHVCM